jgi:hypothetical protein
MKTKTWTVTATMHTDLITEVNAPEHWTEGEVYEWVRNNPPTPMEEDGEGDWTWGDVYESDSPNPNACEVQGEAS